jgi:predicted transcriptional regulator
MMKVNDLLQIEDLELLYAGDESRDISKVFCCDLLSIAMAKAPKDGVWVTVMGNRNTLAVATLADISALILAEGATFDKATLQQAKTECIAVLRTQLPVFDIAFEIHNYKNSK